MKQITFTCNSHCRRTTSIIEPVQVMYSQAHTHTHILQSVFSSHLSVENTLLRDTSEPQLAKTGASYLFQFSGTVYPCLFVEHQDALPKTSIQSHGLYFSVVPSDFCFLISWFASWLHRTYCYYIKTEGGSFLNLLPRPSCPICFGTVDLTADACFDGK